LPGAAAFVAVAFRRARRQAATTHFLEPGAGLRVLRPERGLNAVKQALEPADQLGLSMPNLGFARAAVERKR